MQVLAFEPESLTFATLNRNIFLNHKADQIKAICLSLDDRDSLSFLNLKCFLSGNAYNTFNEELNFLGEKFAPQFKQGSIGLTLDHFIELFKASVPNHVKIDVDGNEDKIIRGMAKTLAHSALRTVTVELTKSRDGHSHAIAKLEDLGFSIANDPRYHVRSREQLGTQNFHFIRETSIVLA